MVWSRQFSELVADVQQRADIGGHLSRYPLSLLKRFVAESYATLVQRAAAIGSPQYTQWVALNTASPSAHPAGGVTVPLADSTGTTYPGPVLAMVAKVNGQRTVLPCVSHAEMLQLIEGTTTDPNPVAWCVSHGGTEGASTSGSSTPIVWFAPSLLAGTSAVVQVPLSNRLTESSADSFVVLGEQLGFDWLLNDVCIKVAARDKNLSAQAALWTSERDRAWTLLREAVRSNGRPVQASRVTVPRLGTWRNR